MKNLLGILLVASCVVAAPLCACSSSTTTSSTDVDTSDAGGQSEAGLKDVAVTNDAAKDGQAADASGPCNTLVNTAPEASSSTVKGNAPAATGGTILDGKYFLTEFNVYDPAGPAQPASPSGLKVTLFIKGAEMDSIQTLPDDSVDTFAETFVVSGTNLNRTLSCPKAGPDLKAVYSVSGNTLTIYETDASSKLVAGSVYAKQ